MAEFAGATFGNGLYRIHDKVTGPRAESLLSEAFPEFAFRICPFGYDWLGRQFAVDSDRIVDGQPQVLLFEPGTGEALEIPLPMSAFHDEGLLEYPDAVLAADFFESWSATNTALLPVRRDQCVGYRVPLFLSGQDEPENLELSDLEVYWSICGQLRLGAMSLPTGSSINQVSMVAE